MSENEEKKCGCKILAVMTVISLLLSIAALSLSIMTYTGNGMTTGQSQKEVTISRKYDKGKSYAKALKKEKPMIVFFYADWCGFCKRFAPTFNEITKDKRIKKHFAIAYVNSDDSNNAEVLGQYEVQGYPTVYVVNNGERKQLNNATFFRPDSAKIVAEDALKFIGIEE